MGIGIFREMLRVLESPCFRQRQLGQLVELQMPGGDKGEIKEVGNRHYISFLHLC